MKKYLFGTDITPSCSYCAHGTLNEETGMIDCSRRKKTFSPNDSCNKFLYSPIKRIPKKNLDIQSINFSDPDVKIDEE